MRSPHARAAPAVHAALLALPPPPPLLRRRPRTLPPPRTARPGRAPTTPVTASPQTLLDDVNNLDPAQEEPFRVYKHDREEYKKRVREQVKFLRGT